MPFIGNDRAFAPFPVSVEVANSLLRATNILDGGAVRNKAFENFAQQFARYADWLKARIVRLRNADGTEWVGWHSEHLGDGTKIHLWETSQVVLFLTHYAALSTKDAAAAGSDAPPG